MLVLLLVESALFLVIANLPVSQSTLQTYSGTIASTWSMIESGSAAFPSHSPPLGDCSSGR